MNENFIKVIGALLIEGISVELSSTEPNKLISGTIQIGSKSGTGSLYWNGEDVCLETRYGKVDIIDMDNIINDIAYVAWYWYLDYKDRGYGPSITWLPIWERMGLISKKVIHKTEYIIH
jgi:hypothetical protein